MKIAIIGGGMAGTACAYVLNQYGAACEIYERGSDLGSGASGNEIGLYNPRFAAQKDPQSIFYASAFGMVLREFENIKRAGGDLNWKRCGALYLMENEKRTIRFQKTFKSWGWDKAHMRIVNADEASDVAGVLLEHEALYLPDAGYVSPKKLCAHYARDAKIHYDAQVKSLENIDADIIVLACGTGVLQFEECQNLPLQKVRGQITHVASSSVLSGLKTNLCYSGYCTPSINGEHVIGATFQRWLDHEDIIDEDDGENIQKLRTVLPDLDDGLNVTNRRAALRVSSKDYLPMIGRLNEKVYISAAHGSHGILSALMGAHIIADEILGHPASQPASVLKALNPNRFCDKR